MLEVVEEDAVSISRLRAEDASVASDGRFARAIGEPVASRPRSRPGRYRYVPVDVRWSDRSISSHNDARPRSCLAQAA